MPLQWDVWTRIEPLSVQWRRDASDASGSQASTDGVRLTPARTVRVTGSKTSSGELTFQFEYKELPTPWPSTDFEGVDGDDGSGGSGGSGRRW